MTFPAPHHPLHSKTSCLRKFVQDSWTLISHLPSESAPWSGLDRTGKDAVRWQRARIRRAIQTLLPTLMHLEGQLSGHQQGQHKQCSLHCGGSWSALFRAGFRLLYTPLAPQAQPTSLPVGPQVCGQAPGTGAPLALGVFTVEDHPVLRAELLEDMWGYLCQRSVETKWLHSKPNALFSGPQPSPVFLIILSPNLSWLWGKHSPKLSRGNHRNIKDRSTPL